LEIHKSLKAIEPWGFFLFDGSQSKTETKPAIAKSETSGGYSFEIRNLFSFLDQSR